MGILDLENATPGRPALCFAGGPSLAQGLAQLPKDAGFIYPLIAVQTALKPMLKAGVAPHLVCALDYHEISGRFYEGLTWRDVACTDLVALGQSHPVIPGSWPGTIRMPNDGIANVLLGDEAPERGTLRAGGSVAHMVHHLARYMGCDPVIWVGLDQCCPDGLYYGPNAAIHQVWSGELNPFNTVEMMEHQRVQRHCGVTVQDWHGRPARTDGQMEGYRAEFVKFFRADADAGLTTIDTSPAGAFKEHALHMSLADALVAHRPPTYCIGWQRNGRESMRWPEVVHESD